MEVLDGRKNDRWRPPFKDYYNNDLTVGKGVEKWMIKSNECDKL
jgi:hypothetical protein